jgi:hypothetical protein
MDFLQKYFNGVFELPLPRNAQKCTGKKIQEQKSRMVGGWVWDLVNVRGSPSIFFASPSYIAKGPGEKNKRGRCHGTFF